MKKCLECKETKSLDEFYKDKRRKDNHGIYCKTCWALKYTSSDEQISARRIAVKKHWDSKSGTPKFKQQRRTNQLKYLYKLSLADFHKMMEKQDGKCSVCSVIFDDVNTPRVDHDHACCPTNKTCGKCIRELLCNRCNQLIGQSGEDIDVLNNAVTYLRRYYP